MNPLCFNRPGVSDEFLARAGCHHVDESECERTYGFRAKGIAIPFRKPTGEPILSAGKPFARVRMESPAKNQKYDQRAIPGVHVFTPPNFTEHEKGKPLFVIEGEFKSMALAESGLCAVGICGICGAAQTTDGEPQLNLELVDLLRHQEPETLVFAGDSDVVLNNQFASEAVKFRRLICGSNQFSSVKTFIVTKPPFTEAKGFDDCRQKHGEGFQKWLAATVAGGYEVTAKTSEVEVFACLLDREIGPVGEALLPVDAHGLREKLLNSAYALWRQTGAKITLRPLLAKALHVKECEIDKAIGDVAKRKKQKRIGKQGIVSNAEPAKRFPAFYDASAKGYWIQDNRGVWIEINEVAVRRHLKAIGVSPICAKDEFLSPLESELNRLQRDESVDFAGSLAGCSKGVVEMGGRRILVKDSPRLIEPLPGDWPTIESFLSNLFCDAKYNQLPYVLGWLKIGYQALRSGNRRPGQLLAIAGEHDCGKSLFQNLVTQILGGRSAKPYRYMSGGTEFNGELFSAEHLMIEDEAAGSDGRTRRNFGAKIKEITVNQVQSCHSKNRQAISLEPFWRLTLTVNREPENLMILPLLDQSLEDKIMLLSANKRPMPMPTVTATQREVFWAALMAELPAFIHSFLKYAIPQHLHSERFGVTHFHHPELLSAVDAMAPESRLLALVDLELLSSPGSTGWTGTAEELEKKLFASPSSWAAKSLLNWPNVTGTYLGRLANKPEPRVFGHRTSSQRLWTIKKP